MRGGDAVGEVVDWRRPAEGGNLPVNFAEIEEKVRQLSAERLSLIRRRMAEKEVTDLTFRRKYYRTYQKHFMAFYLLFSLGCMAKYYSVISLRSHHVLLNELAERGSALIFQALEDKAAVIHRKRNIDPYLAALEAKYPGIGRDLNYDTQSRFWVPFDVRYPMASGMRASVHGGRQMRLSLVTPIANIVPI